MANLFIAGPFGCLCHHGHIRAVIPQVEEALCLNLICAEALHITPTQFPASTLLIISFTDRQIKSFSDRQNWAMGRTWSASLAVAFFSSDCRCLSSPARLSSPIVSADGSCRRKLPCLHHDHETTGYLNAAE